VRTVAAFLVALSAVLALGWVLQPSFVDNGPTPFDQHVTNWFVDHRSQTWTTVMKAFTWLGSSWIIVPLAVVVTGFLLWQRRWWIAAFLATAVAGASLLSVIAKHVIGRDRPPEALRLQHATGSAFPSGHSTQAAATYLALALVVAVLTDDRHIRAVTRTAAVVIITAVGVSRAYLGMHWATDVIGGWLLGTTWVVGLRLAFGPRMMPDHRTAAPHGLDPDATREQA
jgi:undecaprenyl-diphosphatase